MSRPAHAALDEWLRRHHGVVSRSALLAAGTSPRAVDRLVRSQRLVPMHEGIFRSPAHPESPLQLMVAACLLHPLAAVAFTSAGQLLGLRGMSDRRVHILVPHGVKLRLTGVVVHRCRRIDPIDVTGRRRDGIRLTSPPRTLFDAASIIGREATESAIEHALAERMCSMRTLIATSHRLAHPRRPGSREFAGVIMSRDVLRRAARSDLEVLMRRALQRHGLPEPVVNLHLVLPDGTPAEIDLAWEDWKVALEVDHPFWHAGAAEARRDKRRDRLLAAMGWLPQRVTEADIEDELDRTIAEIGAVLVDRGWTRPRTAA